jgi:predicted enzyme involved in methoxymalonyl-ACP biosynthesis
LLSCRVIGRKADTALLSCVAAWAREQGVQTLIGEFIPTTKNAPATDCYQRHGFEPLPGDGPVARWALPVRARGVAWPACIAVAGGVPA